MHCQVFRKSKFLVCTDEMHKYLILQLFESIDWAILKPILKNGVKIRGMSAMYLCNLYNYNVIQLGGLINISDSRIYSSVRRAIRVLCVI